MSRADEKTKQLEEQVLEYRGQISNYDMMHGVLENQFKKNEK